MKTHLLASFTALALLHPATAAARPIAPRDLATLRRIAEPVVSRDGHWAVFQLRETDWGGNKGTFDIWALDLAKKGAAPFKLAADPAFNEKSPAFAADGFVLFLSDRSGADEVWRVKVTGGAATQVTNGALEIGGFVPSPQGDKLLVWASRPINTPTLATRVAEKPTDQGSARTYDRLFVRHWDTWFGPAKSHLFVVSLVDGKASDGVAIDPALDGDVPSTPFGGKEELAWSPDGATVYFALREAGRIEATSTNLDIFSAPADGSAPPTNLTEANLATDTFPAVSPDGKWLAYAAMKRPGYESDRLVIQLRNLATGETRALTEGWDRSAISLAWSNDGHSLFVTADDTLDVPLFSVDIATGKVTRVTGEGAVSAVAPLPGGDALVTMDSLTAPDDLYRVDAHGRTERLSWVNADKLRGIVMPAVARFSFAGANGDKVWGLTVKPAAGRAAKKLPTVLLVHGGPQGSFNDSWSYRWNPAVFAGDRYGIVSIDFHGSTGYGQGFTDSINRDWGGKPLQDLKLGLAAATAKFPWLDADNACAAGGSYGGYMMNWIAGNWPDRFKCLITHDGVFDARGMAYETEELWFDEWEHGGPYYEHPEEFEKWNPVNHVTAWKTPMLIIHGEKDYRIPDTQGLGAFTALQRRGVPSRLVIFPDENHWVLKPRNSVQWYGEVLGWIGKWTGMPRR